MFIIGEKTLIVIPVQARIQSNQLLPGPQLFWSEKKQRTRQ